jgi:hypothetical protein
MSVSYHNRNAVFACRSPLMLSDRLLSLAQDAEKAGCAATAQRLLALAHSVFDEAIVPAPRPVRDIPKPVSLRGAPAAIFARRQVQGSGSAPQAAR